MAELSKALNILREAAASLTAEIKRLDGEIARLSRERSQMASAPVSKAEYIDFIRRDITRKGGNYVRDIRRDIAGRRKEYNFLAGMAASGNSQSTPYLTASAYGMPTEVTEGAMYGLFGEQIAAGIAAIIEDMDWPESGLPAAKREAAMQALDSQITELQKSRDELAAQLVEAGLAG